MSPPSPRLPVIPSSPGSLTQDGISTWTVLFRPTPTRPQPLHLVNFSRSAEKPSPIRRPQLVSIKAP